MLCELMADLDDLRHMMKKNGPITRGRHGYPVISPLFRAITQKTEQVRRMLIEFGMPPSSRTRGGTTGDSGKGEFDF